jgi:hypothetical protein
VQPKEKTKVQLILYFVKDEVGTSGFLETVKVYIQDKKCQKKGNKLTCIVAIHRNDKFNKNKIII